LRDDPGVSNYLDHLLAVDEFTRRSPGGCVAGGYEMHGIARDAGLVTQGDEVAANWTGVCVELGYLTHGPASAGDRRPPTPGRVWTGSEVQRYNDYRVTASGREEADRLRRQARERRTDVALGLDLPGICGSSMGQSLPKLFKQAREAAGSEASGEEVANSLAATVQRLAELRNAVGAGHGHAVVPDVGEREARLAASAASAVAVFVLGLE
jgi:hypothetical protein